VCSKGKREGTQRMRWCKEGDYDDDDDDEEEEEEL